MSILSVMIWMLIGSLIGAAVGPWLTVEWLIRRERRRGAQRRETYAIQRARLLVARRARMDLAVRAGDSRGFRPGFSGMSAVPDDDTGVDGDPTKPVVVPDTVRRRHLDAASDERQARLKAMQKQYHDMRNDEFAAYLRGERPDPRD